MKGLLEKEKTLSLTQKIVQLEEEIKQDSQKTSYKYLQLLNKLAKLSLTINPKRANELSMQAIGLARAQANDSEMVQALSNLSVAQSTLGKYAIAHHNARKALDLSRKTSDYDSQLLAQNRLAIIDNMNERPVEAVENLVEVYKLALEKKSSNFVFLALNNIAFFFISMDNTARALHYFKILQKQLVRLETEKNMGMVLQNIVECYLSLGKYPEALKYLRKSEKYVEEDELISADQDALYASYYLQIYNFEKAISYAELALKKYKIFDNSIGIAQSILSLAELYEKVFEKSKAKNSYNKAIELCKDTAQRDIHIKSILGLAKIYITENEFEKALVLFQELFKLDKDGKVAADAYNILSKYFEEQKDFSKSLAYYKKYTELKLKVMQKNIELNKFSSRITQELTYILKELN